MNLANLTVCALALAVAACGSGDDPLPPSAANQSADEPPAGPPPEWKELQDLAASVHETFPDLPKWEDQVALRKGKRDGTEHLKSLGELQKSWRNWGDEPSDWMLLRAFGKRGFETMQERPAKPDDIKLAIEASLPAAAGMQTLRTYDVLTAYDLLDEQRAGAAIDAVIALQNAMFRVELLAAAGMYERAEQELRTWLDVMLLIEHNSSWLARLVYTSLVRALLEMIINGDLRSLLANDAICESIVRIREDGPGGYWEAAWHELAFASHSIRTASPDDWDLEEISEALSDLKIRIATIETIGYLNHDPIEADVYADLKRPYGRTGSESGTRVLVMNIYREIQLRGSWIAYDLARMDLESPLLTRAADLDKKVGECPALYSTLDVATRKVSLLITSKHLIYKDLEEYQRRSLVELTLQELPEKD